MCVGWGTLWGSTFSYRSSEGDWYSWWCKTTAEAKKLEISGWQHASQHFLMLIINYLCLPAYTGKHYNWKLFPTQKSDPSTDDHGIPGSELQLLSSTQSVLCFRSLCQLESQASEYKALQYVRNYENPAIILVSTSCGEYKSVFPLLGWQILQCDLARYSLLVGFRNYFLSFKFCHFYPLSC